MKTYDAKDIRNVLLVGHGGAGKTTLLEAMLFASGAITRMGNGRGRQHRLRPRPRRAAPTASPSRCPWRPIEWKGVKINVLDAPGYADFVGDVRSAIRAADAVIVVVSAVDGVEVQTEAAWELAVEEGLPRAIFVNKLDRERADFQATLDAARVGLRQPGRALRAPDRRGARVPRHRRPPAREGRPATRAARAPRRSDGPTRSTRWPTPPARS